MKPILLPLLLAALLLAACRPSVTPDPMPVPTPTAEPAPTAVPTRLPYETPDWFGQSVLYEIFVRSFRDSDGDGTGDLRGVTEQLDYIQSLGADSIWLMPIYPSPSYHGYDVTDFLAVNPEYGTLADLQELVAQAHARGMRVLLDFVPSHLSDQNPLFAEAYGNPASAHSDWFVWTNDAHTFYAGFAGSEDMPRFNHYNPEVVDYLSEAALFWLDLDGDGDYSDGVDGFRIDNATFPPPEFFLEFRQRIKQANPEALLLGETWVHSASDLRIYFEDQFDALFDFPLYEQLLGEQTANLSGNLNNKGQAVLLSIRLQDEAKYFLPQSMPVRFLANHDTNRLYTKVGGDPARLRLAADLLAALPGPLMIYYGEEIGMPGQKGGSPDWDKYRREPMDWYALEAGPGQATWFRPEDRWNRPSDGISVEEQQNDPSSLLNHYRNVIALRAATPALLDGELTILNLTAAQAGPWGFLRAGDSQSVIALFNFANTQIEVTIPSFPFDAPALTDLLSGQILPPAVAGQAYTLTLPAAGAVWLAQP